MAGSDGGRLQASLVPEKIEAIAFNDSLVVDTSVLFYLTRANLIEEMIECWNVIIPESVKVESIRKPCKETGILSRILEGGKIIVEKDFCEFPAENDVIKISLEKGVPMIVDDWRIVREAFKRGLLFTSSPMVPVLLFLNDKLNGREMEEKVNEILELGFFSEKVKIFMGEVINYYRGKQIGKV